MQGSESNPVGVALPERCLKCNEPLPSPAVCASCKTLFPADHIDYFALFKLPREYDIDAEALRRQYMRLSRETHPDRYVGHDDRQAQLAMRISARLNDAYRTLTDPIQRAEYLLQLSGGQTASEDKTVPHEVLAQTLMIREELEELSESGADEGQLTHLREQVDGGYDHHAEKVAALASQLPGSENTRRALRAELSSIKYYQRMREQL